MCNLNDYVADKAPGLYFLLLVLVVPAHAAEGDVSKWHDTSLPIDVQARYISIDQKKQVMIYKGNVRVQQGDLKIHADRAIVHLDRQRQPVRIDATGNPVTVNKVIKDKDAALRAKEVTYRTSSSTLSLKGTAEFQWGEDTIKGEQMEYLLEENRVRLEKQAAPIRAWLHSLPEAKKENSDEGNDKGNKE